MSARERYEEAFWPLAALPLLLLGVGAAVLLHPSAVAIGALAALAVAAALGEFILLSVTVEY